MPTVLRVGGFRFAFFAADAEEPIHVHVVRDANAAKFWLQPFVRMARNRGFRPHELNEIERLVIEYIDVLVEAWHDYFGR
jgi:hypothetical protein